MPEHTWLYQRTLLSIHHPHCTLPRSYKHWRGPAGFYAGLPQRLEFESFAKEFNFV